MAPANDLSTSRPISQLLSCPPEVRKEILRYLFKPTILPDGRIQYVPTATLLVCHTLEEDVAQILRSWLPCPHDYVRLSGPKSVRHLRDVIIYLQKLAEDFGREKEWNGINLEIMWFDNPLREPDRHLDVRLSAPQKRYFSKMQPIEDAWNEAVGVGVLELGSGEGNLFRLHDNMADLSPYVHGLRVNIGLISKQPTANCGDKSLPLSTLWKLTIESLRSMLKWQFYDSKNFWDKRPVEVVGKLFVKDKDAVQKAIEDVGDGFIPRTWRGWEGVVGFRELQLSPSEDGEVLNMRLRVDMLVGGLAEDW